jgi:hypothetical protein
MHQNIPGNSISHIILKTFTQTGLKPEEFIISLGYQSVQEGVRDLNCWIKNGEGDIGLLEKLVTTYNLDPKLLNRDQARSKGWFIKDQQTEIETEIAGRENFKPYVFVEVSENCPELVSATVFTGARKRFIGLPDGLDEYSDEQVMNFVQDLVSRHYEQSRGKCSPFGDITGYRYIKNYDENVHLDINGQIKKHEYQHFLTSVQGQVKVAGGEVYQIKIGRVA